MASLRKRGKKGEWYALYRDAEGKLKQLPTNTTDRKLAQQLADEWEAAARPTKAMKTVEAMRRAMAETYKKLHGSEMLRMSVAEFGKVWLEIRKGEVTIASHLAYKRVVDSFVTFLNERATDDMFFVSREDVQRFRDALASKVSATTTNNNLRILRMWFKQARSDGWITENVAELVKPVRGKSGPLAVKKEKRPFTVAELQKLFVTIDEMIEEAPSELRKKQLAEWKSIIMRGYYTGQRLSDIVSMRVGTEDLLQRQVTMRTIKTGQVISLEMHEAYVSYVLSLPSSDDANAPLHPLAFKSYVENEGRVVSLSEQFAAILRRGGFRPAKIYKRATDDEPAGPKRSGKGELKTHYDLSFHSLRHTFVSHLQDAGVPKSVVQDMVGHESAAVNRLYTHLDRETKKTAIDKLPDIFSKKS